jgi:hypothetical protein
MATKSSDATRPAEAPTFSQLTEFFKQIESGRVTSDRLRAFMQGEQPLPPEERARKLGLSRERTAQLVRFWDEQFPEKGNDIVNLIGPFYSPDLSFLLQPPARDLEKKVKRALFWFPKDVTVRVVTGERPYPWDADWGKDIFWLFPEDRKPIVDYPEADRLKDCLHNSLWDNLAPIISSHIQVGLWTSLFWGVASIIYRRNDNDFRPLFELWRSGNLPIGVGGGKVNVLCAKT